MKSAFSAYPSNPGIVSGGNLQYQFLKSGGSKLAYGTVYHPSTRPYIQAESMNWQKKLKETVKEAEKTETQVRLNAQTGTQTTIEKPDNRNAGSAFTADYHTFYNQTLRYRKYIWFGILIGGVYYFFFK